MRTHSENGNLYTPEVMPMIAGGQIPPYNVFPFSGVYRDLSDLLTDPSANFANNVQAAASGMMTGLVSDGNPQTLMDNVLFYGRQIEAARQLERQQKPSKTSYTHKTEPSKKEESLPQTHPADKQAVENEKLSLSPAVSDTVTALGKALSHLVKSEFTISLPTAKLGTHTLACDTPSVGVAPGNMTLAA